MTINLSFHFIRSHIEFEYEKAAYHLKDVVIGRIHFLMVRVKVVRMELSLLRREVTGSGTNRIDW